MVTRIATVDLRPGMVPRRVDARDLADVVAFAETFNGYAWGGGPHVLGPRVAEVHDAWVDGAGLPTDPDLLRACLFHWARARRHRPDGVDDAPDDHERRWLDAVLEALREVLRP